MRRFFASSRAVAFWLFAVAAIVFGMVALGGLTRLTGSGLSITQWDPIMGAIPPMSDAAWHAAFAKYQQIPQYRLENHGMTLDGFKAIFWWEWTHRLLGRIVGFAFAVPCLLFFWTGAIRRAEWPRMLLLFALGGLQGAVGWWMVMSGLETRVSVSQYRLAIHLGVAIILLGALLWIALEYLRTSSPPPRGAASADASARQGNLTCRGEAFRRSREVEAPKALRVGGVALVALIYLQMLLGALVAGLHAGLIYNTWPSMDGHVFPELSFTWTSFFEDPGLAQFDHRIGAYIVFIAALTLALRVRKARPSPQAVNASGIVAALTVFQVVLGIVTLVSQAPVALAAAHQLTAAALFCAAVWQAFDLRREVPSEARRSGTTRSAPGPDPR
ncbi:MAG TPA: COX15/CtaA family protein [Rhizomicrobium sp.]|nr:COX15/CtaA family protein [Rhizomicrobium sp.]